MLGLYTSREGRRGSGKGKWRLAALPFMAGGYVGVNEREEGETARNYRG
jgi:hypothetical protein